MSQGNLKVVQLAPPAAPVGGSPEGTGRCRPIIMLAHALDLNVVAEGVEFASQRHVLIDLGCGRVQGFFFAASGPPDRMDDLALPRRSFQ